MFLEIKQIRKAFGQGDNRVEVLRGIDLSLNKGTARTRAKSLSMASPCPI